MTLEDYLKRRARRITVLAAVIAVAFWGLTEIVPGLQWWRSAWPMLPFLVFLVHMVANNGVRCPRCLATLHTIESEPRSRRGGPTPVGFDRCTHCGLHVKEELRPTDHVETWP
jgi:TRAP-type C4-dicarboxylate transport system permease small subunit